MKTFALTFLVVSVTVNDKKSVTRVQFVAWLVPKPPEKYGALHPTRPHSSL
ncbi:hypothetical protein PF003_g25239 [Phytophthora fragariae]|nr:hypothetical protein PF003_g25239 [Phytophthora fragariae]